jgi:PAS domain S-box-containing protein
MDGTNSYINEAGRKMLGFTTEEEVLKTPISQLHAPEDFELVQNEVLPTVMSKGQWAGRMMVKHLQTGEIFPVFNNCIRINDPVTGEIIGIGAVMRDQRPELAAKQALADSEQLLRNITRAAPTGLWMVNDQGALTYINQTWLDWVGFSYESQMGYGWLNAILEKDREKVNQKFLLAARHHQVFEVEFRIVHVDGTIHWCNATGKPQYNNETFTGYIGACVDITEQKLLQQQKDDFIGIASHELKTPVTSIKAYTQILERMLLKKGEEKEALMISKMDAQINRLTSLIGDLLDVTKINSGKLQFNDRNFEFNELVEEIVEDLQRTTEQHELVVKLAEVGIVYGDRERIGQVITNLITNAIKYSPTAQKVAICTKNSSDEVSLCVEDFGVGIPSDKLGRVFEQFYRVSGDMQHTFPGLGLGLYISAEIWVNSESGKGSKFCFALPIRKKVK